ncbi:hypothetical protein DV737_g926, partial [Chaetothyriales sp. CBS 132003]
MSEVSSKILEGVFAVKKPPSLSSAQVLRDLQCRFKESKTFQPLLRHTEGKEQNPGQARSKRRKISSDNVFKMGHGGTLDPLATGVLIVGIGRGTKHLASFLECTKTYDTVVLFGKSTDTYDVAGKIVAEAQTGHITKQLIGDKLDQFRGKITQMPPIYSALKINGMKAYEYARTGKELPRELESRAMVVDECRMLEFFEAGQHDYRWPAAKAAEEDRLAARKLMKGLARTEGKPEPGPPESEEDSTARQEVKTDGQKPALSKEELNSMAPAAKAALHTHDIPTLRECAADAPAASFRLTVSSGFYVRSFAHDLGVACDSFGIMAELARTRQGDYTSLQPAPAELIPCLTYEEFDQGEEVWGPKIAGILGQWMEKNPAAGQVGVDSRDGRSAHWRSRPRNKQGAGGPTVHVGTAGRGGKRDRRRNSSSPE